MAKSKDKINAVFTWFGIINHPKEKTASKADFEAVITKIVKYYSDNFLFATILHDRDTQQNETTGRTEPKTMHLHLFLDTRDKIYTKEEIINHIAKHLELPNECIQIEPASDIYGCIQYLTHKNKPYKTQYKASEIVSNHPEELVKFYLTDFECLLQAQNMEELVKLRDLKFLRENRTLLNDLKNQKQPSQLEKENRIYERYFGLIEEWLSGKEHDQEKLESILSLMHEKLYLLYQNKKPRF